MRERALDLLWNGRTRRPRLPWRLVSVFVILGVIAGAAGVIAPALRTSLETLLRVALPGPQASLAAGNVVFFVAQGVAVVGAVFLTGRYVDRRQFRDFGFRVDRGWWLDLAFGLVLGAALMSAIFALEYAAGWVSVVGTFRVARAGFAFWPWFGWVLVVFVGIGITEELLARGYLLKNVAEGLTWVDRVGPPAAVAVAVLCSALLFAAGHLANPNASLASTAGIAVAAVMLASGYVATGELAIPIGVHVTWNLFQGPIYGFPVSGLDFGLSVLAVAVRGPTQFTGGAFGPEAGLLGVAASLVGIALTLWWVRWRTGDLRIHPALTTPALRSPPGPPRPEADTERGDGARDDPERGERNDGMGRPECDGDVDGVPEGHSGGDGGPGRSGTDGE